MVQLSSASPPVEGCSSTGGRSNGTWPIRSCNKATMKNPQISFKGVRSSKFRHVYGCGARKERCYENLSITRNAHDSHFCAVNPKFLAVVTEVAGGGAFAVIPLEKTGRMDIHMGRVTGHRGPVLDIKWNPFNDNVIASCSDDCTIKLWYIPDEGLQSNLTEWLVDLHGHKRRVGYVEWHPTAENILLSAGFDHLIIVWNIGDGEAVNVIDCHPDIIYCMSFNWDGSRLATTCKDKLLRILDPRTGKVLEETPCHEGSKASKVVYLGDSGRLFTTGFSRYSDRQYAMWSERDLSFPLRMDTIDSSSGVLFPYYDHDTHMVYLAGKGDGNIRYYELVDDAPWCYYLNQFLSGSPQRGLGSMPKRGLDVRQCEVFRFYKLHAVRGLVEPLSMIVPRKSEQFQEDLYPDTPAPTPSLTAEEWINGKNASPIVISMRRCGAVRTHKPVVLKPREQQLITSDRNNERKFAFIAQETRPDYRPIQAKEGDASQSGNGDTAPKSPGVRRFQQIHHLWDQRSSPSGPNQDGDEGDNAREEMNGRSGEDNERKLTNGVHREPPEVIHNDKYVNDDLSLTTQQLREEVKRLRKEVTQRDKRIRELQGQIRLLTSHPS